MCNMDKNVLFYLRFMKEILENVTKILNSRCCIGLPVIK